jgi:hypothetical protein
LRVIARNRAPVALNWQTTWRPTFPVPPMMRIRFIKDPSYRAGSARGSFDERNDRAALPSRFEVLLHALN